MNKDNLIGEILATRSSMLMIQSAIKAMRTRAVQEAEAATQNVADFGRYADCGPSYDDALLVANSRLTEKNELVPLLIKHQQKLKALKYSFSAQFPEAIGELNFALNWMTVELDKKMRGRGLRKKQIIKEKDRKLSKQAQVAA